MRAAVDAVQQAACRLQDAIAAGMLSGLSQMLDAEAPASAAEIAAASSELEKLVLGDFDDKAKEAEEAKARAGLCKLCLASPRSILAPSKRKTTEAEVFKLWLIHWSRNLSIP